MPIQIYLNGHEWLARKLQANAVRYTKLDNAFVWIEDMPERNALPIDSPS